MKERGRAGRRLAALTAAGLTLWAAAATAGSQTAAAAVEALRAEAASPLRLLRWELGDLWGGDGLSGAAVLALGEAPLLLSAREEVEKLWSKERAERAAQSREEPPAVTEPVAETPLAADSPADNGVPARTLVPAGADGYTVAGPVYISNSTSHALNVSALSEPFAAELTGESPQILILHTHGSEAYTPAPGTAVVYSGDRRSTDPRYGVVRVGDVMAEEFAAAGLSVLHDRTMYDYPSYAGAYDRSLAAVESYLAQYPSLRFVLDVHRDAITDGEGVEYKVLSGRKRPEGAAAQMTLVVGSDGSGMAHPGWMENLKLAAALQRQLLSEDATLMRPILLRNSRYNQHAAAGSLLVEVGAAGNSPEEAALAGRLFARGMAAALEDRSK